MTETETQTRVKLCSHCSTIDFDALRLPTASQLRPSLADGDGHHTQHPPTRSDSANTGGMWDLETVERIRYSAKVCTFCDIISRLLDDLEQAGNSVGPKLFCEVMIAIRGSWGLESAGDLEQLNLEKDSLNARRQERDSLKSLSFRFTEVKQAEGRTDEARQPWAISWIQAYSVPHPVQLFDDGGIKDDMTLFGGRRISPLFPIGMILSWKNECLSKHDASCSITPMLRSSRISLFRLIDVTERAVVRLSNVDIADLHYVALSYVWGKDAQKTTLMRNNKRSLSMPGALDGIISRTIEDAIDLTKLLGLQYIWVDALCIVQDDIPDKSHHLAFMDQVCRYAEVTVIAASGNDANAGLPGLHKPRRIHQHVFKIADATPSTNELCLITSPTIRPAWKYTYLDGSEWNSRGWTLQEKVMSRRTLVFTDTKVYWSCRGAKWAEGLHAETHLTRATFFDSGAGSGFLGGKEADLHNSTPWDDLQFQMADFSSRNFTVDGDAYSAFSAILQEFSDLAGERFLWAIPASRFEIGLCWYRQWNWGITSGTHLTRRTGLSTLPSTTLKCNAPFPSWSWLGWQGRVQMCLSDQYRETGMIEEIVCFVVRNEPLRVVKVSGIESDSTEAQESLMVQRARRSNPNTVTLESITSEYPELTKERLKTTPDNQIIAFWSDVGIFATVGPVREENDFYYDLDFSGFDIYNVNKEGMGTKKCGRTELCSPGDGNDPIIKAGEGYFEFVLLATCEVLENDPAENSMTKDLRAKSDLPPKKRFEKVVMQISRDGHGKGVATRICTGRIWEDEWNGANPERRLVVLN